MERKRRRRRRNPRRQGEGSPRSPKTVTKNLLKNPRLLVLVRPRNLSRMLTKRMQRQRRSPRRRQPPAKNLNPKRSQRLRPSQSRRQRLNQRQKLRLNPGPRLLQRRRLRRRMRNLVKTSVTKLTGLPMKRMRTLLRKPPGRSASVLLLPNPRSQLPGLRGISPRHPRNRLLSPSKRMTKSKHPDHVPFMLPVSVPVSCFSWFAKYILPCRATSPPLRQI